jgi:hypothetical protein
LPGLETRFVHELACERKAVEKSNSKLDERSVMVNGIGFCRKKFEARRAIGAYGDIGAIAAAGVTDSSRWLGLPKVGYTIV